MESCVYLCPIAWKIEFGHTNFLWPSRSGATTASFSMSMASYGNPDSATLISKRGTHFARSGKLVILGVSWKTPSLIVLWTFVGFVLALAHQFYYCSLDGTKPGSPTRQSWPVLFGTAFAFLVVPSLRAACDIVYKQYIWTLFKRKAFSLNA